MEGETFLVATQTILIYPIAGKALLIVVIVDSEGPVLSDLTSCTIQVVSSYLRIMRESMKEFLSVANPALVQGSPSPHTLDLPPLAGTYRAQVGKR